MSWCIRRHLAKSGHRRNALDWLQRTNQYTARLACQMTRYIYAVVLPIDKVDIGIARRPEENGIERRLDPRGMGRLILYAQYASTSVILPTSGTLR